MSLTSTCRQFFQGNWQGERHLEALIIIIIIIKADKKLKYKSLCIEIQRMWNLKCTIIPVINGATGIVTRSLWKILEDISGKRSIDSLQKTAILGKSHIIWKVLRYETWSLIGGDHRWFKRSARKKRPVTRDDNTNNNNNNNNNTAGLATCRTESVPYHSRSALWGTEVS